MKTILAEIKALEKKLAETGPRGGHIIGKTKSGKPIYDSFDHEAHKDFDFSDHTDASQAHSNAAYKMMKNNPKPVDQWPDAEKKQYKYHDDQAFKHSAQAPKSTRRR